MMTPFRKHRGFLSGLAIGAAAVAIAVGMTSSGAAATSSEVKACVDKTSRTVRIPAQGGCSAKESLLTWSVQGPAGARGATGARGDTGATGATGATGPEGPEGPEGPSGEQGEQGEQGLQGEQGPVGPAGPSGTTGIFGTGTQQGSAGSGRDCYLGEIILSAGSVVQGVPATGQILQIATNPVLFSILGAAFGGNGTTTFALPDLTDAAPDGMTYSICTEGIFPARAG